MLLTAAMLLSALPMQALAYYASDADRPVQILDGSGNSIPVTEDWQTTFPYGTFAFAVNEATVEEGGDGTVIQVYRLGGTKGRATAYLSYIPATADMGGGEISYANAAGANDIVIEVEDPLPIAQYQPVGRAPDPERGEAAVLEEAYAGEDAEEGDRSLYLDTEAESYQWYLWDGSAWNAVSGASEATFVVSEADYADYDFRCVYTKDGVSYCTDSLQGVAYEKPEAEALEPMPDDLDLNPEQTFSVLEMDPDDPYLGYVFSMTFAEDEWVKEIRVSAPEDDISEAIKGGYFTIVDCEGGSLYDTANTLALGVYDNDAAEASELGFTVTEIEADKSAGTAVLTVKRTGGTQNVLSLSYTTEDGTAEAGKDYAAVSGTLAFYADVTEQTIEIPLIDDGVETEEQVSFRVVLSDLLGDSEGICTLTNTEAEVRLYNSASGGQDNLATMLYDGEAVDASGSVDETPGSAAPVTSQTVTGVQNREPEVLEAVISQPGEEGIQPLTFNYGAILDLRRSNISNYNNSYWRDWAYVANETTYGGDISAVGGFTGSTWSGDGEKAGSGWKVQSDHKVTATLEIPNMSYMFKSYKGHYKFDVGILNHDLFGAEFTYPWASVVRYDNSDRDRVNCPVDWDWGFFTGYHYYWKTGGTLDSSWSMSETDLRGLQIGLSRHDAHDSSDDGHCIIDRGALERRSFTQDLQLRIHTANDGESGGGNVATAPAGAAALTSDSDVYRAMKPAVSLVPQKGGVTSGGDLYVGSTLRVELKNTPSYDPYTGDKLSAAIYVTRANGSTVNAKIERVSGSNAYNVTMLWDGMKDSDLTDTYTINVVMVRNQELKLDLSPSVERKVLDGSPLAEIDTAKVPAGWDRFWNSGSDHITVGYSPVQSAAPHFTAKLSYANLTKSSAWGGGSSDPVKLLSGDNLEKLGIQNIQNINFNRSAEDRILYNGRIYAGNETIWLDVADLALPNATFRYYHKDFLSATSVMTADINSVGLYLDVNCNGRIDGYYDEAIGYFMLDEGTEDEFVMYLDAGKDYDEGVFAPVPVKWDADGNAIQYAQYFVKVLYTMTPRALTPEAGHENDKAQVMPAFVTNVTDADEYAKLTGEQQAYRYIISGQNRTRGRDDKEAGAYGRSADNHPMYGAVAGTPQMIDVPLGGDTSPAELVEGEERYAWTPDYQGNLLYPFENPEPIFIAHSLAGDNISIAGDFEIQDGKAVLTEDAVARLNGYLGSFAGNSTVALCIQQQTQTTEEIAAATGASSGGDLSGGSDLELQAATEAEAPKPESSTLAQRGTFPNSDYLKEMDAGGDPLTPEVDMEEADGDFEEFEVDLGVELPSTDIGVTDYVTVIMDGYEVGFSIGLPLGGYDSNGDAGAGGPGGSGDSKWFDTKKANASNAEDMGKLRDFLSNPSKSTAQAADDSYDAAQGGEMSSSGFEVGFSASMAFLFKYNSVDNTYYFSQFSIAVAAELEYTYQQRLTPCPIVYLYVKVGFGIELGTGATVERETVEESRPVLNQSRTLESGETYEFKTRYKAFNITFDGKVALELTDGNGNRVSDSVSGYLNSDGGDPITATMRHQDGVELDKEYTVRVTALEKTELKRIARVEEMETKSYWSGFQLSPEGFIEAGAGIGIEILKFEVYIKIGLGCAMTFGAWDAEAEKYKPFEFDEFEFSLGLGFRVVLLVFSYEMDLISYSITYDKDDGWKHSWSALGGLYGDDIGALSAEDADGNIYGVTIRLPGDTTETQRIYSGGYSDELSTLAFEANDKEVPFQLSGYGSSGDAFKLADGLITGYDYQVITVGSDNYLLYTIGREDAAHPVDSTMLVLSRLRLTSTEGVEEYGLVNPANPDAAQPYIILDDDGTGDLDFSAWVDGDTIHAAWVSYATVGQPTAELPEPDASVHPKPVQGGEPMDAENYTSFAPPTAPAEVQDPGARPSEPVEPVESAYYTTITAEAYDALTEEQKSQYTKIDDSTYGRPADGTDYADYTEAKAAYDEAAAQYQEDLEAYNSYDDRKAAYEEYLEEKADYEKEKAAFDAWFNHFKSLTDHEASVQEIAAAAAQNTVVKKASYEVGSTAFTSPKVVSGEDAEGPKTGSFVYLPEGEGDGSVTVYAQAEHMSPGEKQQAVEDYTAYLKTIGYDPTAGNSDEAKRTIGSYRLAYQSGLWDAYGKGSSICVALDGAETISQLKLAEGQILDNFEVAEIDGVYYLAYTTSEMQYTDADGNEAAADQAEDLVTIKRLFLRTFTIGTESGPDGTGGSPAVVWTNHGGAPEDAQKGVLLRTAYDYDMGGGKRSDGMYQSGALLSGYQDPYFANLQFLRGELGDSLKGTSEDFELMSAGGLESFLLFEMNGCTYVIRQESLESIAAEQTGSIIPFFAYEPQAGAEKAQSTGRAEVTIGADGAGNLSAVYVAPVANTTNNALYLSKYDPATGSWGAGTMLAMSRMDVYEDSLNAGWSTEEAGEAYLGRLDGYDKGGMDQFVFSGLQIAAGQKASAAAAAEGETASGGSMSRSEAQQLLGAAGTLAAEGEVDLSGQLTAAQLNLLGEKGAEDASRDTLLVITQGTMTYLKEHEDRVNGGTVIAPMSDREAQAAYEGYVAAGDERANRAPGVGMYAVSYGVGGQSIGEAQLTFASYDFSAGARLHAAVSFVNTGDVGIRAADVDGQRVTARLMAGSTELASWSIVSNIVPGQKVQLTGDFTLAESLPEGTVLSLHVEEGSFYAGSGGVPFSDTAELLTVEKKPELGFEELNIEAAGIDADGNTVLSVDFLAGNRGSETAQGVFVQFSYDTGETDAEGNPVYAPLDLSGNTLAVGKQEALETMSVTVNDFANGIFYLSNSADGDDIRPGYGRHVQGTLTIPAALYQGALTGSFNIRTELYSAADDTTGWDSGLVIVEHGEYNTADNVRTVQIEHKTFFSVASKVTIPMGNTMRLPVAVSATTGEKAPVILVEEFPTQGESRHLGILNYQSGTYANGTDANGTLVLAPSSTGNGIIRVLDMNTNSFFDVAYTVTDAKEGINIFNDNAMFTFHNKNGTEYDPAVPVGSQDWLFQSSMDQWGADGTEPYLSNLSRGKVGASFTFTTQAQSIELIFNGTVKVESNFPGFTARTISAGGGDGEGAGESAAVYFGSNETNYSHQVTITVLEAAGTGPYADFDRLIETYGGKGEPPVPAEDAASPHIFWSRSFPDTASVTSGETVTISAYILDDGELSSVTVDGQTPKTLTKRAAGYWEIEIDFTENGTIQVAAQDAAGNRTAHNVEVDWFNTTPSAGASAKVPELEARLTKEDGTELTDEVPFGKDDTAQIRTEAKPSEPGGTVTVTTTFITADAEGGLKQSEVTGAGGIFPAANNGWYLVTAEEETAGGTRWTSQLIVMNRIDTSLPVVTLDRSQEYSGGSPVLTWTVRKDTGTSTVKNTIQEVTINGQKMQISTGQTALSGSFTATHGGSYTAVAVDTVDNRGSVSYELQNVPVALADGKAETDLFTIANARKDSQGSKANGSVVLTADPRGVLVGGTYDQALTPEQLAAGQYRGVYEWKLVQAEAAAQGAALAALLDADGWSQETRLDGREPGAYVLYVRDRQEPQNAGTVAAFPLVIGDESIAVTLEKQTDEESGQVSLAWSVKKGDGALVRLTSVTLNGYPLTADVFQAAGNFALTHTGRYTLTATDGTSTESAVVDLGPTEIPIAVYGSAVNILTDNPLTADEDETAALATLHNSWNLANNNGSIDVDVSVLYGGQYADGSSAAAENRYVGSYAWQLRRLGDFDEAYTLAQLKEAWLQEHPEIPDESAIPADALEAIEAEVARLKAEADAGETVLDWNTGDAADGLSSGRYRLIVRDAQNPESGNLLELLLILDNESIRIQAASEEASSRTSEDGSVTASASGGYGQGGTYQFILRPVKAEDQTVEIRQMTDPLDPEQYPDREAPVWQTADLAGGQADTGVFTGLTPGWYQVAARPMVGATADQMENLFGLYAGYTAADAELKAAEAAASESGIAGTVASGKAELEAALQKWRSAEPGEAQDAAWTAYAALVANNDAVLSSLRAWEAQGFGWGETRDAYYEAVDTYFVTTVTAAAAERLAAARTAQAAALQAYTSAEEALVNATEDAYAANPGLWENAASTVIHVSYHVSNKQIEIADLEYPDSDTVRYAYISSKRELSSSAEKRLISDNAERDIIAESDVMLVVIPKGTLQAGDDIDQMMLPFVDLPKNPEGHVVQWIGDDGETMLVGWSLVTKDRVAYLASRPGTYRIVSNPVAFGDVTEAFWGFEEIGFTASRELFNGMGGDLFRPQGTMTRAMFVTVLGRLADADPADDGKRTFSDVEPDSWYGPYVAWAAENGIVNGVGGGRFAPDAPVTREQICTILSRYLDENGLNLPEAAESPASFRDADQISAWAEAAVERFARAGVVEGNNRGSFLPQDNASRAECAAIYARLIRSVLTGYKG